MRNKSFYSLIFFLVTLSGLWPAVNAAAVATIHQAQPATPTPLGEAGGVAPLPAPANQNIGLGQALTNENTASFHPVWSPDGRRIAFHRRIGGWKHLFVMNGDGSALQQLTSGENANFDPAWSRQDRIAFVCNRKQIEQICRVNADGTGFAQLTVSNRNSSQPTWSPDGRLLIFGQGCSLYTMDADGATLTERVRGSEFKCASFPAWSPDGSKIALRIGSASGGELFIMTADGLTQLTADGGNARKPTWSPDSKQIAFERDGQLFLINVDGTGLRELTPVGSTGNRYPDWSPRGNFIVFERQMGKDLTYGDALYQLYVISVTATGRQVLDPPPPVSPPVSAPSQPRILPQSLLGKTLADQELVDYLLGNGCSLQRMHYVCKAVGIELSLTTAQRLVTVFFYAEGADGFKQYQDELPYGLVWRDTRLAVEGKLGPPTSVNAGLDNQVWVSYDSLNLAITYQSADSTAQMRDIRVSLRR